MFQLSLTARELLQKIAKDAGLSYDSVASRVNETMKEGEGLIDAVGALAKENNLNPDKYQINATKIVDEISNILQEDYTQTLMMSAVLGQMVEAKGKDRFPVPAFFVFLELLAQAPQVPIDTKSETSQQIKNQHTNYIDLRVHQQLLLSQNLVLCQWRFIL